MALGFGLVSALGEGRAAAFSPTSPFSSLPASVPAVAAVAAVAVVAVLPELPVPPELPVLLPPVLVEVVAREEVEETGEVWGSSILHLSRAC